MTPKPCKCCGSIWHSKNKCPERPKQPLPEGFLQKRAVVPLSPRNAPEALKLAYKGNSERSQLTGLADKYFGEYIRTKSEYCYTCGQKKEGLQCGHFMARRYINTRWSEMNCHPQCNDCNVTKHGNLIIYERNLRREYGNEAIDNLKTIARNGNKVTTADIQEVIEKYKGVAFL